VHETGLQHGAVFAKANLGLGSLYYEWNRLDDALRYLTEGMRLAEQGGYLDQLLLGAAVLARIQNTRGDLRGLQETIKRTRRMAEKYGEPPQAVSFIKALEADMAQQQDDRLLLDHWLTHQARGGATPANLFAQYERMTLARVLAAKKDYTGVSDVIKPVWEHALRQGRLKTVITCEAMMARCLFMQGQPLPAVSILQGALFKAEPNRFVRSFLDEGGVMISMIKQLLSARGEKKPGPEECSTEYLYLLLDEVARDTMQASTSRPVPKSEDGLEPLTPQEMHILDMLEAGYPNKQIAQELNISLNTVKYHLKNIYGKMGVVNRTQAARILRKEGA
jgi:LuxR family maltose regulon positive regulatory protein